MANQRSGLEARLISAVDSVILSCNISNCATLHRYELGSSGKYLWVKVRRPTKHALGFQVLGGVDKALGGSFVTFVGSTSASQLQVRLAISLSNVELVHGHSICRDVALVEIFYSSHLPTLPNAVLQGQRHLPR
jgi:hypothetical protein